MKNSLYQLIISALLLTLPSFVWAENDQKLKPYILAYEDVGELSLVVNRVREQIVSGGFEVVGEYLPYENAHLFLISNDEIREAALTSPCGVYAALQRVSVTRNGEKTEVVFFNPLYMAQAYRMRDDMRFVYEQLIDSLSMCKSFGSTEGIKPGKLKYYQYAFVAEQRDQLV